MHIFRHKTKQDQLITGRRPVSERLSASGQNRTFSYHANRSTNTTNIGRSSSLIDARTNERSRLYSLVHHMPVIIASIIILACIVNELILSTSPKVIPLYSSTGQLFLQSTTVYQKAATTILDSSIYNRDKLTIDAGGISISLKRMFPELKDVSVTLPILGHRPIVYIEPAEPSLALATSTGIFLLDHNGKALTQVKDHTKLGSHITLVTDQSGLQAAVGRTVVPSTTVDFVNTVVAQLKAQDIVVRSIILPAAADEVDIFISGVSYYGKFNMQDGSALQQSGAFVAVSRQLVGQGKTPAQYIDVRINGRAYYK